MNAMNVILNLRSVASAMIRLLFAAGFIASTCLTQAQTNIPLVPMGAVWKYLDTGVDQGADWIAPAFNDGAWASGAAQLGYGILMRPRWWALGLIRTTSTSLLTSVKVLW